MDVFEQEKKKKLLAGIEPAPRVLQSGIVTITISYVER